jgi:hypothetical protein
MRFSISYIRHRVKKLRPGIVSAGPNKTLRAVGFFRLGQRVSGTHPYSASHHTRSRGPQSAQFLLPGPLSSMSGSSDNSRDSIDARRSWQHAGFQRIVLRLTSQRCG